MEVEAIQKRALAEGLPYQTLIASLPHKYASGRLKRSDSPDANYYGLLLVALLERGGPLTLEEGALRFEEAGVAPAPERVLHSDGGTEDRRSRRPAR